MFARAIATAKRIFDFAGVPAGMSVRCECLDKPKHNTLAYARVPVGNIVIFDISLEDGSEKYISPAEVTDYASAWGLETVPLLWEGLITEGEFKRQLKTWMDRESFLGGSKIEGVVIKNYAYCDGMGKSLCGKFVSDAFKEHNAENWKAQSHGSAIDQIIASFNQEAIWNKAIQHKREEGSLTNSPKDIGMLIGEVKKDFHEEHGEAIKRRIFKEFYSDIERGIMHGFPEWYKKKLVEEA